MTDSRGRATTSSIVQNAVEPESHCADLRADLGAGHERHERWRWGRERLGSTPQPANVAASASAPCDA